MAKRVEDRTIGDAVSLLKENGFEGLAGQVLEHRAASEPD